MTRALLLALTLAGCGHGPATTVLAVPSARPPAALLICPPAPPPVPVPPVPRGLDAVVEFGRETDARREETVKALERCRQSLEGLVRWISERGSS